MEEKVTFAPKTVKIKGGEILIRLLREEDGPQLALEEQAQGWGTTTEKFEMRMRDFAAGACIPLCAELDGKPVCVVVPSDCEVSMKKLASAFGGKSAQMMKPADAERITGYHVGGISPFGQKKRIPTAIDESAFGEAYVYINGGQRGLQVKLDPQDARRVLEAIVAPLTA